jgi:adenine-specific DNA-methyltransferase
LGKPEITYQKLRGGYYTPQPIADFLAQWAIRSPQASVLEPSCGDGALLAAAVKVLAERGAGKQAAAELVHGVEFDEGERLKALARLESLGYLLPQAAIHWGDFFAYCHERLGAAGMLPFSGQSEPKLFDAVIGNPPFIRYQNFQEAHRQPAFEIMRRAGLSPNRLTNSWVPFVVAASFLLTEQGRLAMVIPAELLQVNYAAELRRFLSDYFQRITLITFRRLVFEGIQQEVVLLLAERGGGGVSGIRTVELQEMTDLARYEHRDFTDRELKPMDHSTEKWTQYFLDKKEIGLLRALRLHQGLTEAEKVIDVDVGIVTGQNEFFVLSKARAEGLSLKRWTRRLVSRSGHLKGIVFSDTDWRANAESELPAYLLDLPDKPAEALSEAAQTYIAFGEAAELNVGFKCRTRKRWHVVPSVWTPDAFMLRQVHGYPKIILNQAGATCTDTIHRVKFRGGADGSLIAAAFLNSLTFAFSEVTGRSYGGGVLELEPNEAERLPLPLHNAARLDLSELHGLLLQERVTDVLAVTDRILLIEGLGLSLKEARLLRGIWQKLRDRRINRKHTAKKGINPVAQAKGFSANGKSRMDEAVAVGS